MLTKINTIQIKYKIKMCVKIKIHLFLTLLFMSFHLFKTQFEFNKLVKYKN
jgi:hypothetical protein